MEHGYSDKYYLVDNKFWEALELFCEVQVPVYVKNVLSVNGYGSLPSFTRITDTSFEDMETTIRSFYQQGDKGSADTLNMYHSMPTLFKIVPGHRQLVLEVSEKLSSKKLEFLKVIYITYEYILLH